MAQGFTRLQAWLLRVTLAALMYVALSQLGTIAAKGPANIDANLLGAKAVRANATSMWGAETASVNWCEDDYVVTRYFAEFWSTVSSAAIVFLGLYGILKNWHIQSLKTIGCFSSIVVVGLGSTAFHGTLRRDMQLLDELPMLWGNAVILYTMVVLFDNWSDRSKLALAVGLGVSTAVLNVLILFYDNEGHDIFLASHASWMMVWFFLGVYRQAVGIGSYVCLMELSGICYLVGLIVWGWDRLYCPTVQRYYFHAWWHVGAAYGTFFPCLMILLAQQQHVRKNAAAALRGPFFAVYIDVGDDGGDKKRA